MNVGALGRLIIRLSVLMMATKVLSHGVTSIFSGASSEFAMLVVVVALSIVSYLWVWPLLGEVFRPGARPDTGTRSHRDVSDTSRASAAEGGASGTNVVAVVAVCTSMVWVAAAAVARAHHQEEGVSALLRQGVMFTGAIAGLAILAMRIVGLSERGLRVAFTDGRVLRVLLIAALGWWVAPLLAMWFATGRYSWDDYSKAVFPVIYVAFPALALLLRKYRGR